MRYLPSSSRPPLSTSLYLCVARCWPSSTRLARQSTHRSTPGKIHCLSNKQISISTITHRWILLSDTWTFSTHCSKRHRVVGVLPTAGKVRSYFDDNVFQGKIVHKPDTAEGLTEVGGHDVESFNSLLPQCSSHVSCPNQTHADLLGGALNEQGPLLGLGPSLEFVLFQIMGN